MKQVQQLDLQTLDRWKAPGVHGAQSFTLAMQHSNGLLASICSKSVCGSEECTQQLQQCQQLTADALEAPSAGPKILP